MKNARNAVSYVRVSGLGQRDGDGPERQREAIARTAKRERLHMVKEYTDLGVSGTVEAVERPGLTQLVMEAVTLGVNVVVIERADRLARDLLVQELALRQFRQLGITVLAADGQNLTDTQNPTGVLLAQIMGAFAQFDRASTVAKLRAARDRKRAATGRCEGAKPFGELPGEAEALAALRALARKKPGCDPLTWAEVAAKANAAGIRSRSGKPWTRGTCWNVLRAS
jgi:DNA invertase Pin-like site-specific DNA recombinase